MSCAKLIPAKASYLDFGQLAYAEAVFSAELQLISKLRNKISKWWWVAGLIENKANSA